MNVAIAHRNLSAREALATSVRARGLQVYAVPDIAGVIAAAEQARLLLALVEPELLRRDAVDLRSQIRARAGYDTGVYALANSLDESFREAFVRHGALLVPRAPDDTRGLAEWVKTEVDARVAKGALTEGLAPGKHWGSAKGKGAELGHPGDGTLPTILVVEDEPTFRHFLCDALGDKGYTVWAAENGADALEFFRSRGADLILSDVNMPGMDGFELKQNIDMFKKTATPFILMTADGRRDNLDDAAAMGITFILGKPIRNLDALYAIVGEALKSPPK